MMRVAAIDLRECCRFAFRTIVKSTVMLAMPTSLHSAEGYGFKLWFLLYLHVFIATAFPALQVDADNDGLHHALPSDKALTLIQRSIVKSTSDLHLEPPKYSCNYDPETPIQKPFPAPLNWYSCADVAVQFKHDFDPERQWKLNTGHTDKKVFHLIKTPWTYGQGDCAVKISYSPKWSQPVIWPEDIVDETRLVQRRCVARKWPPLAGLAGEEGKGQGLGQDLYKWGGKVVLSGVGNLGVEYTVTIELMPRAWLSDKAEEEGEAQGSLSIAAPVDTA